MQASKLWRQISMLYRSKGEKYADEPLANRQIGYSSSSCKRRVGPVAAEQRAALHLSTGALSRERISVKEMAIIGKGN